MIPSLGGHFCSKKHLKTPSSIQYTFWYRFYFRNNNNFTAMSSKHTLEQIINKSKDVYKLSTLTQATLDLTDNKLGK